MRGINSPFVRLTRLLVVTLVASSLLAACGTEPTATPAVTTTAAATTAANPVTLTWSFWGDDAEVAIDNKLIEQFEKFNPGIKVKPLYEQWENYFTRLEKDWTGNNAPDVMFLSYIPNYASQGILENLDPYLAGEKEAKEFNLADFHQGLLDIFRYNNSLYGIPRDNDTKVIYVNLKMLQAAGVPVPKAGWTWQDLRDAAKKLTRRDANGNITQYGFAFEPNDWWKLWVWQNGGEIYDSFTAPDPPSHMLLNSPEAIEGIQFFADLINKDKVTPTYDGMDTSREITQLFQDGKLAMAFGGHGKVPVFSGTRNLSWDIVPLPMGKKRVNVLGGAGYAIHKNSQHKAEAWKLVKFLGSELGQGFFMETGVMVPARQSVREDNIYVRDSKYNWEVFVEETKVGKRVPQFRSSNDISKMVDDALVPVWKGTKTTSEVLTTLPKQIDPILASLRK